MAVVQDILRVSRNKDLYVSDDSATGLSVTARLDELLMPHKTLSRPTHHWTDGLLIARSPAVENTEIYKTYSLGSHQLYLLCRGNGCQD